MSKQVTLIDLEKKFNRCGKVEGLEISVYEYRSRMEREESAMHVRNPIAFYKAH